MAKFVLPKKKTGTHSLVRRQDAQTQKKGACTNIRIETQPYANVKKLDENHRWESHVRVRENETSLKNDFS